MIERHDLERLHDLLDGRTSPAERDRLRVDLKERDELRTEWDRLVHVSRLLREWEAPELAPGFADRVMRRIEGLDASEASTEARRPARILPWDATTFTAVLVSVAATFLLVTFLFRVPSGFPSETHEARGPVEGATGAESKKVRESLAEAERLPGKKGEELEFGGRFVREKARGAPEDSATGAGEVENEEELRSERPRQELEAMPQRAPSETPLEDRGIALRNLLRGSLGRLEETEAEEGASVSKGGDVLAPSAPRAYVAEPQLRVRPLRIETTPEEAKALRERLRSLGLVALPRISLDGLSAEPLASGTYVGLLVGEDASEERLSRLIEEKFALGVVIGVQGRGEVADSDSRASEDDRQRRDRRENVEGSTRRREEPGRADETPASRGGGRVPQTEVQGGAGPVLILLEIVPRRQR